MPCIYKVFLICRIERQFLFPTIPSFNIILSSIIIAFIWNPIHLVHVSTYRYVPTCTDLYYAIVCTGTYYLRNVAKRYRSVHTGTYQYKKMSKSTYAYVLNCVQSGTGQYSKVPGSTRNGTRQYRSKYNKVQGSTWRYMSVHSLHLRRAAGGGAGRAADFGALLKSLH